MESISQNYDIDQWLSVRQEINHNKYNIASQAEEFTIESISCNIELNEISKKHLEEIEIIKFESERTQAKINEFIKLTDNNEANILLLDYINNTNKGEKMLETKTKVSNDKWNGHIAKYNDVLNILNKAVESGATDPSSVKALTNMFVKNVINSIEVPKEKTQQDNASVSSDRLIAEDIKNCLSKYESKALLEDNHSSKDNDKTE